MKDFELDSEFNINDLRLHLDLKILVLFKNISQQTKSLMCQVVLSFNTLFKSTNSKFKSVNFINSQFIYNKVQLRLTFEATQRTVKQGGQ